LKGQSNKNVDRLKQILIQAGIPIDRSAPVRVRPRSEPAGLEVSVSVRGLRPSHLNQAKKAVADAGLDKVFHLDPALPVKDSRRGHDLLEKPVGRMVFLSKEVE